MKWPQQDSDRDDMALPLKMNVVAELFKMRSYENGMVGREKFETKDCIRKGMAVISRYWCLESKLKRIGHSLLNLRSR